VFVEWKGQSMYIQISQLIKGSVYVRIYPDISVTGKGLSMYIQISQLIKGSVYVYIQISQLTERVYLCISRYLS